MALSLSGCASWSERGVLEPLHAQLTPHLADAATTLTLQRDDNAIRTAAAQADALLQAPSTPMARCGWPCCCIAVCKRVCTPWA